MDRIKPGSRRLHPAAFVDEIRLLLFAGTIHSAITDEVDDAMKLAGIKPGPVCATHVNDDTGAAREVHAVHQVAAMRTAQVTDRAERDRSAHRNP